MSTLRRPSVAVGILSGVLLFAHASIPHSLSWPFIWPFLGGIAGVVWIAQQSGVRTSVASALGIGARVGAIAAVVAIVGCVASLPFIMHGETRSTVLFSIATLGIVVAMLFAVPAAMIGSALAGALSSVNRHRVL